MTETLAGTYAALAGTEIVNNTRVLSYLRNGLGPASLTVHGDCGNCGSCSTCGCSNIFDLLGCFPDQVELLQCIDLPGVAGNYLSTPDTAANSLQGTESALALSGHSGTYASTPDSGALSLHSTASALRLTGHSNTYLSTPDSVTNSITGNIDIRVRLSMDDWTPPASTAIVSKWDSSGVEDAFILSVEPSGSLRLVLSQNGTTGSTHTSTVATGFTNETVHWVRATFQTAGDVIFYTSDDGVIWTQLGANVASSVTAIYDSNREIRIGTLVASPIFLIGIIYNVEIRNDVNGTIVVNPDFTTSPWVIGDTAATARADTTGNIWTMSGNAEIKDQAERRSLRLSGAAGVYASTPDSAGLSITGDIDIRVKVAMDDWTPATVGTFVGKYEASSGNQRAYLFQINAAGTLRLTWSTDGTAAVVKDSTVATGVADGAVKWVRVTLDVDNGAAGNDVKFYTSNDGSSWAQLGATVTTAGVTSIFDSTASVILGAWGNTSANDRLTGNVFYAEIRNGIDGSIRANPDFTSKPWDVGDTSTATGADTIGNIWTLNGTGAIIQSSYVSDLDIRVKVALDDWTPSVINYIIGKYNDVNGQRSYLFGVNSTSGKFLYVWSPNGTTVVVAESTSAPTVVNGAVKWLRVTHDVDNGAAGNDVKFYTSDSGVTWTQLGTTVTTAGVTSIFDSPTVAEISGHSIGASQMLTGRIYYAEIRNGIGGTIVANPDFTETPWVIGDQSATARADTSGNTWTLQGNAEIVAEAERRSLRLSGAINAYASTPDSASLSITGDIDLRCKVALDDWTPAAQRSFIGKYNPTGSQRSYWFYINTSGNLILQWSADGSTVINKTSTVPTGIADNAAKWVRATLDVDNGAAGNTVTFYTSDDGETWAQLGSTLVTAGVTSIFDSTAGLAVGAQSSAGTDILVGNVFFAEVRNGIDGTVVANPDFQKRPWDVGDTSTATGTDTSGNTWTLNGTGSVIQRAFASDLDIRVKAALDSWVTGPDTHQILIAKNNTQISYFLYVEGATGKLVMAWSANGITAVSSNASTVAIPFTAGSIGWVRATVDIDNGSGGSTIRYYTSSDGITWSQLGSDVVISNLAYYAVYDSTVALEIGSRTAGTARYVQGNIYYAEVINATEGTTVALFDPTDFLADTAQTPTTFEGWTINGAAWAWCEYAALYPYYPYVSFPGYTSPTADDAPWYSADLPTSADFLGFYADEFEGMDSTFSRSVNESIINGGILGRSRLGTRELRWRGYLFGTTCCSVQYGLRWLTKTLSRFDTSCQDCFGDDLEMLVCCPNADEPVTGTGSPFRLLKGVGLIEGPKILSERKTCTSGCSSSCGGSCIIEVEFALVATQPYFYSPEIPVYDCVSIGLNSTTPVTDAFEDCGPFDCSDDLLAAACPVTSVPPTAAYQNSCLAVVEAQLGPATYLTVPRSTWPDLEEVVPVISITNNSGFAFTGVKLGFYVSPSDNPCGDIFNNVPGCDVLCDELIIGYIPGQSSFYIDGRTRKMSLICFDNNTAFPGERHTNGPWSWPTFRNYGFCLEIQYVIDEPQADDVCVSLSLVPRTF